MSASNLLTAEPIAACHALTSRRRLLSDRAAGDEPAVDAVLKAGEDTPAVTISPLDIEFYAHGLKLTV